MNLQEARMEINDIDDQMAKLLVRRMEMTRSVADYKREHDLPVLDASRERDVLARVAAVAGEEHALDAKVLFSTLFDISKTAQVKQNHRPGELSDEVNAALKTTPQLFPQSAAVACQGVEGSYAQQACDKLFYKPDILYFSRFEGVFQAVESGMCRYGVLPIENSTAGSVAAVYDLMRAHKFHIARSVRLKIEHMLLAKPGVKLADVKEIYSHEQALRQCGEYLSGLKGVKLTACENTAVAAQMAAQSERSDVAAIASANCAPLYGLSVLAENVQNNLFNYTRFICISRDMEIYPGANRVSVMTTLPHEAGSLYRALARFAVLGVNLSKIESRPIPGRDFEFMFYFDIEASVLQPGVLALLEDLCASSDMFILLGNYSEVI